MTLPPSMEDRSNDVLTARRIITHLGQSGTPPQEGLEWYTVGLDEYLQVLQEEYLDSLIPSGVSSFKLVIGSYGGGKTHFLYCLRNLAVRLGYAVAYVSLSPAECPFNQLDTVYRALLDGLEYPLGDEARTTQPQYLRGVEAFLRYAYLDAAAKLELDSRHREDRRRRLDTYLHQFTNIESTSFRRALDAAFRAQMEEDEDLFLTVVQWLKGEKVGSETLRSLNIVEGVDARSAFRMIRSLAQWIRQAGLRGLVVLFDEAERSISLHSSRQIMTALDHLRQWIDECGQGRFPSVLTLYAVPNEMMLIDRPGPSYEALRQRLHTVFSRWEPTGVKIYLERLQMDPKEFLHQLGDRLLAIYQRAYDIALPAELAKRNLVVLADRVYQMRYADISYRRLFVTSVIPLLHRMRRDSGFALTEEKADAWILQRAEASEREQTSRSDDHEF